MLLLSLPGGAVAQDAPPSAPAAPGIDIGGLVSGIGQAFQTTLQGWANGLPDQTALNGTTQVREFWSWASLQGMNFVVRTPPELVTTVGNQIGLNSVKPLLEAVVALAIVLAGVSYAGHQWFGWPGLGESAGRILVTIILVGSSFRLMLLSITAVNGIVGSVAARFPSLPNIGGGNAIIIFALLLIWIILAMRLAIQMGKRIVWLALLYAFGPFALVSWIHEKSAWIAGTWAKLWIGWLIGQIVVVLSLMAVAAMVDLGGPAGYLLSVAALLVAYDAVHIFAPSNGGMTVSVGVGPARIRF